MKLRNKKTGEIAEANDWNIMQEYASLAELTADWEDYSSLEYWWIDGGCDVLFCDEEGDVWEEIKKQREAIGNYFETKEEAEKAVEKLEASVFQPFIRFEFKRWTFEPDLDHVNFITIEAEMPTIKGSMDDLELLFETTEESSATGGGK